MAEKPKVTLLFRKRSPRFNSIEEIFRNLSAALKGQFSIEELHLKYFSNGILNKLRNVFFTAGLSGSRLLHVTGEIYYACLLFRGKLIVTVHDIGSLRSGSKLKRTFIKLFWFQLVANKADAITIISESSRAEYLGEVSVDPSKVHVIHNPAPSSFKYQPKEPMAGIPVLLQIGTKPNKNLERLITAIAGIDCTLRIIGKLTEQQRQLLEKHHISYESFFGITAEEVYRLYVECDVVTFVSTYEGFGMPIIEAQAVGRAVITSAVSSMPEVAGRGALLVDPYKVQDIREGILRIINDQPFRKALIEAGRVNVERFHVNHISRQYAQLYNQIYAGR